MTKRQNLRSASFEKHLWLPIFDENLEYQFEFWYK